jgi:K+-sensing histidine kinase KdpD
MTKASVAGKVAGWIDRASGYLLAIATTCTAAGVRLAMQQELQDRSRLMLFIPAVLVTAWYGGVGPGVFSLALGVFLCAWLLIPPANTINFGDRAEQVGMVVYLFVGAGVIVLVHRERIEKRRREVAQKQLERLNHSLENRVKERTRDLEIANRELEGFCYSVSHDLRTPTRAIVGNIHILIEDFGGSLDAPIQQRLDRISKAAMKLSDLVDALLTYARLAKSGVRKESVDLGALITEEANRCTQGRAVRLILERPSEIFVTGDKAQLRSAIEALVSNAATYGKPGEDVKLTVSYERTESDVVVTFHDNGIGFDMQYVHKIFEPFERLHRDEDYPGIGMGLANVARIAERHDGAVWAESSPGHGASFHLRLGGQEAVNLQERQLLSA